jgi:hypothetical protein
MIGPIDKKFNKVLSISLMLVLLPINEILAQTFDVEAAKKEGKIVVIQCCKGWLPGCGEGG